MLIREADKPSLIFQVLPTCRSRLDCAYNRSQGFFAAVSLAELAGVEEPITDTVEYQHMPVFNACI